MATTKPVVISNTPRMERPARRTPPLLIRIIRQRFHPALQILILILPTLLVLILTQETAPQSRPQLAPVQEVLVVPSTMVQVYPATRETETMRYVQLLRLLRAPVPGLAVDQERE